MRRPNQTEAAVVVLTIALSRALSKLKPEDSLMVITQEEVDELWGSQKSLLRIQTSGEWNKKYRIVYSGEALPKPEPPGRVFDLG